MNAESPLRPTQHARHLLLTAIIEGEYPPGFELPSERNLSEQMGVTRPTLREALQRLAGEGWVTIQHGKKTVVNDYLASGGMGMLSVLAGYFDRLPLEIVPHFLEIRTVALPAIARRAFEKSPRTLLDYLQSAATVRDAPEDVTEYDWGLHQRLVGMTENPILRMILNDFESMFKAMAMRYFSAPAARKASFHFYSSLLESVAAEDGNRVEETARYAMEESIGIWNGLAEGNRK